MTKPKMDVNEALGYLSKLHRDSLVDRTFGDSEVGWWGPEVDGKRQHLAEGYYGRESTTLTIFETPYRAMSEFWGREAEELRRCYATNETSYN